MGSVKKTKASNPRKSPAGKAQGARTAVSPSRGRRHRLRCPFHAKFPEKPRGSNSSCHGTGFKNCARLVEHLKRAHGPLELSDAATAPAGLTPAIAADQEDERVTIEQFTLIAKLPRNPNADKKWDTIYRIIFPGDEASKPAYMPSAEQLRDYARDPPEWLLTNLIERGIGESHQEIVMTLKKFLIFLDIVGGRPSSLPPSLVPPPLTQQGQSSTGSESLVDASFMDGMTGLDVSFGATEAVCSLGVDFGTMHVDYAFTVEDLDSFNADQGFPDRVMADIS